MITEKEPGQSAFRVILWQHNIIQEQGQTFALSNGKELYRVKHNDMESITEHEEVSDLLDSVRRAQTCLNQQICSPWAEVLFVMWAKRGQEALKVGSILSPCQLLCIWLKAITEESLEVNSQPISKSKILSFKQLTPGDYLLVKPLTGYSRHYLISSVRSPLVCTAIEYNNEIVTSKELTLSQQDKFPLYYLINYEPQVCIHKASVVRECQRLINNALGDHIDSQNFAHYLKTKIKLETDVDNLPISCENQPSDSLTRMPQFIEVVNSLDTLACSDHIIFRSSKPPFHPIYQSGLVLSKSQNREIEIATMTYEGIVKIICGLDDLPYLHRVVYEFYHFSEEEVIKRVNEFISNQEQHHFHECDNNSHHFVMHCKCDLGNLQDLVGILKKLERNDQGRYKC